MKLLSLYIILLLLSSCTSHVQPESAEALYTRLSASGFAKQPVQTWVSENQNKANFVDQAKQLVERVATQSPEQLESFVRIMVDQLVADNKEALAAPIAAYPFGIDIAVGEPSEIANRLLIQTRLIGNKAPAIDGLTYKEATPMIVVFYESHCPNCHGLLEYLVARYDSLKAEGIRIVTISTDSDKQTFDTAAAEQPWDDKLCDYQSFNSPTLKRWGVAATPTVYSVDKQGIVSNYTIKE